MSRHHFIICLLAFVLLLTSCGNESTEQAATESEHKTIEWQDLIPEDELEVLLNPPAYIWDIEDGSEEDVLNSSLQSSPANEKQDLYQQALVSTKVIEEFDEQKIRIPGFLVPLEFSENSIVTTFFLVPFFGACTHEPPPPPNQIIFSEFEQGKKIDNIYDPVWVSGAIFTSTQTNELATSAYSMIVDDISTYEYE